MAMGSSLFPILSLTDIFEKKNIFYKEIKPLICWHFEDGTFLSEPNLEIHFRKIKKKINLHI